MATGTATPRTRSRADRPAEHRRRPSARPRPLPGTAKRQRYDAARRLVWVRAHAPSLVIVTALVAFVGAVLATGVAGFPQFADDEGTYVAQAWSTLTQGSLGHYTYWYDHPPLGWIQMALASVVLDPIGGGTGAVADARPLMLVPALASVVLLYVLARRLGVSRTFAAVAVLLFGLSPLAVSWLRSIYLDNWATPWVLAAFVLAASPQKRLWAYAGSGACFAVAVLTKETTVLVLPGLLLLVRQGLDPRTRSFCTAAFACVMALLALGYPLFSLLKGELLPGPGHVSLFEAVRWQLFDRASTGSALTSGTLSNQLVRSWLSEDAWLLGLGAAAVLPALAIRRLRAIAVTLIVLIVGVLRPGYLPQPFVIVMLPFCALLAAGVLDAAARAVAERLPKPRVARVAAPAAVAAVLAIVLWPSWHSADTFATSTDQNANQHAAVSWIDGNIDNRARVLVDDTYYVDLMDAGFRPRFGAVWFYKLDYATNLDPSVQRALPNGWRSFDYVVSSPVMRSALAQNPGSMRQVRDALAHSRVVRAFGSGTQRVEIRRLVGGRSGFLPQPKPKPKAKPQKHKQGRHR
jgi:hypothetical protein